MKAIKMSMEERLQKYMADCGVGSRRKCEEWIQQGEVTVNGETVSVLGSKIDPDKDEVCFRGKRLRLCEERVTVMLNKPAGYVTTSRDQFGRPSVCDLVHLGNLRLYPVGRLDYPTTGLLLLTNDGELDFLLTHPSHHIPRVYEAILRGTPDAEAIARLEKGIRLEDGQKTQPAEVRILSSKENSSKAEFTIYEGKNREVRRMAQAVGFPVLRLRRVRFGSLELGSLQEGRFRILTEEEVRRLRSDAGGKANA